jgi:hypothetical protein
MTFTQKTHTSFARLLSLSPVSLLSLVLDSAYFYYSILDLPVVPDSSPIPAFSDIQVSFASTQT